MASTSYIAPDGTLLASAARTATVSSNAQIQDGRYSGVKVVLDLTAFTTAASLTVTIEAYDPASATWVTLLSGAAVTATGVNTYNIHPVMAAVSNVTANLQLPTKWRATVTHGNANSHTYSLGYIYLP